MQLAITMFDEMKPEREICMVYGPSKRWITKAVTCDNQQKRKGLRGWGRRACRMHGGLKDNPPAQSHEKAASSRTRHHGHIPLPPPDATEELAGCEHVT